MTAIPFPISSSPGVKPQEGAGRLFNCFAIKNEQTARYPVTWRRCAGLREALTVPGFIHLRGAIVVGSTLVAVFDERVFAITKSGVTYSATNLGELTGTGRVTLAKNSNSTPDIVAVTSAGAFNLFVNSAPTDFADSDLPQPNSVAEYKNYFIFTNGSGEIWATGINSVSVASDAFTAAPGPLLRGVSFRGEFFAFGTDFIQPYQDAATAPFPLAPSITGGGVIPRGLVGTHAVAGWEPGWAGEILWTADDSTVRQLVGYEGKVVSNDAVSRDIERAVKAGDGSLLEADVYMQGSVPFWRLTYPGNWTWEYNLQSGNWNEKKSFNRDDNRGSFTVKAFDRWLIGDRATGKLGEIDDAYYREFGEPLPGRGRSGVFAQFPARFQIPRIDLDFTAAVGISTGEDPIQTDPTVLIRWSTDGGYTWSNPVRRKLGKQGVGDQRVTVQRGPMAGPKGVVIEWEVDDPVHVQFHGGQIPVMQRAA